MIKTMEYFDICDENGCPLGETVSRAEAHRLGIRHRTAHIWIIRCVRGRYEVLLQQRSLQKDSFPGLFDTSSAGHVPAGQEPLPSALRELREELGLTAGPEDLQYIGQFHIQYEKVFHEALFRDNEVAWVYVYEKPVEADTLVLQVSEVAAVRWFDMAEVRQEIEHTRERFCVPKASLDLLARWLRER
ncbi:MAG: NUDIX domain-containing protein [Solobacterium sp.]|nr:NUDIX domain-containing protein [Solobacterium sp.]